MFLFIRASVHERGTSHTSTFISTTNFTFEFLRRTVVDVRVFRANAAEENTKGTREEKVLG